MLNLQERNSQRITKQDKEIAKTLDYSGIEFPIKEKDYPLIEQRFSINLNVFYYNKRVFPFYISDKNNEQVLNVLLISNDEKSHYVFIKDFNSLMYQKTRHRGKNTS